MAQDPIPQPPPVGEIRFFDSIRPPLSQGDYKMRMMQTFPQIVDNNETGMNSSEQLDKFFTVNGSRWSIDPLTVHSRFPPKNEQNVKLDLTLPKIVFQSKTLPWERIVDEQNKDLPWMSLLLLREDEFNSCDYYPVAESTEIDAASESVPVKLLEIPSSLLKLIAPTTDEVELLAHSLQVNPRDKELCGNDEDGLFSVILSNRIPSEPNEKYHALLVSLEGSLNELPNENQIQYLTKPPVTKSKMEVVDRLSGVKKASKKGTTKSSSKLRVQSNSHSGKDARPVKGQISRKVKLLVLDYWKFKTGDGGDFESKIKNIRFRKKEENLSEAGELGSVYDFAKEKKQEDSYYEPALLGNDMDPDISANSYLLTDIVEDDGITRPCLYRGPCIAVPTTHQPKTKPYENSDDARGIEPSTGFDVIHHSAAFELGRLLAMSDPQFISSMSRWRRLWNKKEAMKNYREATIASSALTKEFSNEQLANESIKNLLQASVISQASEKFRELVAERVIMEDSIQFEDDIVNPGNGTELDDVRLNQELPLVDDTLVSTDLLNQIDYGRSER
ncbi:MAG: hypothetical protein CMA30_08275 [Euryarchaeota archaeon]|nr:hypothetical protein [Euryarchaeota archaeon]|tara:strand:- start:5558 stop:7237 length:1680 start_codon:yes stop_codon:yes gene_type:complete